MSGDFECLPIGTQRLLDEATALIVEAAALFTGYADHHKARASEPAEPEVVAASLRKAQLNLSMALSLREWLAGVQPTLPLDDVVAVLHRARQQQLPPRVVSIDFPGVTTRKQAERMGQERFANRAGYGNLRPVTTGPLADPAVVAGIAAAIEPGEAGRALSTIKAHGFHLHTADPRFDPAQPVLINGYPFTPATEAQTNGTASAD